MCERRRLSRYAQSFAPIAYRPLAGHGPASLIVGARPGDVFTQRETFQTPGRAMTQHTPQIRIFDTTLRDGEQSPGASMTLREKLELAELLDDMGVDIIEAGFPAASPGDFEAVSQVARQSKRAVI